MRYLVLTDIHANLEALETCLADAQSRGYDRTLVLGDLVGYGADPNAVVERVQALKPTAMVRGNHDKVACGLSPAEGFNVVARSADIDLNLGLIVDVSGSQETFMKQHHKDLQAFLKNVMKSDDRAYLLTFANRIRLVSDFSSSPKELAGAM